MKALRASPRSVPAIAFALALLAVGCASGPSLPAGATVVENVTYLERPAVQLTGDLYLPAGDGPHPGVLLLHGGGWRGGNPGQMAHLGRRLAAAGFAAYSAGYRFTPEHRHPAQLEDARAALAWLGAQDAVDASRLAVWGYSAGAHLALLLAFQAEADAGSQAPHPAAVVAGGSPTDLTLFSPDSRLLVNLLGGSRDENPEAWHSASPVNWVGPANPPTYLYHGSVDRVVDIAHSRALVEALDAAGVPVEYDEVNWGHFWVFLANRSVEARATAFLERTLATGAGRP